MGRFIYCNRFTLALPMIPAQEGHQESKANVSQESLQPHLSIDWDKLICELDPLATKILKAIYQPSATPRTLLDIHNCLKSWHVSHDTVQRRLKKLEQLGLIKRIRSYIVVINPVIGIEENVRRLIISLATRFGLGE